MKKRWIIGFILAIAATFLSACSCGGATGGNDDNSSQNGGQNAEDTIPDGGDDTTDEPTPDTPETPDGPSDEPEIPEEKPTPVVSAITYYAAPQSEVDETTFRLLKKVHGEYPESYTEGVGVTVDGLRNDVIDSTYAYTFIGWYYDEVCLLPCENGVIGTEKTGDITLYAKIQKTLLSDMDDESWGGS
ncbi:MAG: hypothetical protein IJ329_04580 [Clostridia bacterium]|nr:hypothetical protein [Clostridia bacterium]